MTFDRFFRSISYTAVFCGFLSLWVSGTFGLGGTGMFLGVMTAAWFLEGSRWQISERIGTALIVLALPAWYLAFRYQVMAFSGPETMVAGILARMILSLTAIKLLQKKSDRDWIFLYLMSFFEVLLAAGLSISASYVASFLLYLLAMMCAVIAFEMRKTAREVESRIAGGLPETGAKGNSFKFRLRTLPASATVLIVFIVALATPLFFVLPRVGGAGLGSFQNSLSTSTGFSDTVRLGSIGRIQQNDAVVMRVRLETASSGPGALYFRGVALDTFDKRSWSRSKSSAREPYVRGDRDLIQLDYASGRENLLLQTIYLEPLDTPVLFAVPRAVAVQGNFSVLYKDGYGAISFSSTNERVSYKALSDRSLPPVERLRADNQGYSIESQNYLQLPAEYDRRIAELASSVAGNSKNRYDKAAAIASYLRNNYGYTLEMKAGGSEPLADFLFNIREGHCEYFATAMAVMLRTQGVATRLVNGFYEGEYNDTAGLYVVRQRHAHAWVEVYFPKENVWVQFDPTPPSTGDEGAATGILARAGKYLEALDAIWIQYFVAFDDQEQRSLARTVRSGFADYQATTAIYLDQLRTVFGEWWAEVRGDRGTMASVGAVGYAAAAVAGAAGLVFLGVLLFHKIRAQKLHRRIWEWFLPKSRPSMVGFYDRLQLILEEKGLVREPHQTPLEFANATGFPAAVAITEKYNYVRFAARRLTSNESMEVEGMLRELADPEKGSAIE
jgi:protein-glutamine gamma-glutamyltransferase